MCVKDIDRCPNKHKAVVQQHSYINSMAPRRALIGRTPSGVGAPITAGRPCTLPFYMLRASDTPSPSTVVASGRNSAVAVECLALSPVGSLCPHWPARRRGRRPPAERVGLVEALRAAGASIASCISRSGGGLREVQLHDSNDRHTMPHPSAEHRAQGQITFIVSRASAEGFLRGRVADPDWRACSHPQPHQ